MHFIELNVDSILWVLEHIEFQSKAADVHFKDYAQLFSSTYRCPGSILDVPCPLNGGAINPRWGGAIVDFLYAEGQGGLEMDHTVAAISTALDVARKEKKEVSWHLVAHLYFSISPNPAFGAQDWNPNVVPRCANCHSRLSHGHVVPPLDHAYRVPKWALKMI